jgi:hypothetical protein
MSKNTRKISNQQKKPKTQERKNDNKMSKNIGK